MASEYVPLSAMPAQVGGAVPMRQWYELSRRDAIPGQTRIGRKVLVHLPTSFAALEAGGIPSIAEVGQATTG